MAAVISQGFVVFVHSQMFWLLKALCDCLELNVYLRHSDLSPVVLLARDVTKERERALRSCFLAFYIRVVFPSIK